MTSTILIFFLISFNTDSLYIRAGVNADEVKKFIALATENGYHDWACFLVKNMPDVDLVNLKALDFIDYFNALKKNLKRVSWHAKITPELFYHYILPHRVSQEPLENFAALYVDTLYEVIRNSKSMRDAVLAINEWVYTKACYEPTERWDQTATATIMRGVGRCEELSILLIKALRTIIIPARHTYTPWWSHTNSNHAWVEVWVDGNWYCIGAGELTELNDTWFMTHTPRTSIIKSLVFGQLLSSSEIVDREGETFTIINVTPNYTNGTWLVVKTLKDNKPPESVSVSINVYNYSALVPCGVKKTDSVGMVCWYVGRSDLFIYAQKDSLCGFYIWRAQDKSEDTIIINLTLHELPDTAFWLRTTRLEKVQIKSRYRPNLKKLKLLRKNHETKINILTEELKLTLHRVDTSLVSIMSKAYARAYELLPYYFDLPESYKQIFIDYFSGLCSKDIVMTDTIGLMKELHAIKYALSFTAPNVPESIIRNYLITPRILSEQLSKWRALVQEKINEAIPELFSPQEFLPTPEKVRIVFDWTQSNITKKKIPEPFGPQMNPGDVLKAHCATELESYVFVVGVLRSIGIPARVKWDYQKIEYWDGNWYEYGFKVQTSEPKKFASFKFFAKEKNITLDLKYYEDFSITEFKDVPTRL
ncbi:MAG: transglutaminase domain-containing protein, partial [candidate division WOR-3 bacterium]|nr:transglutaminase domain-containing protein [candidate division WOR-3 bacterium]